jgi:hypothetical protein
MEILGDNIKNELVISEEYGFKLKNVVYIFF